MSQSSNKYTTVNRLYQQAIAQKKVPSYNLDSSAQEPAELKLLWERSVTSSAIVCQACCDALVHLVVDGHAEFNYVLNRLLNLAPSAKNLSGLIRAVTDLLRLQMTAVLENSKENFTSPLYGIRSPPHPFITIATNRPDSWLLLHQQVQRLMGLEDSRLQPHVLSLLDPFLKYILLDPHQPSQYTQLRVALTRTLVRGSKSSVTRSGVLRFLLGSLETLQVGNSGNLGGTLSFIEEFSRCLDYTDPESLNTTAVWSHEVRSTLVTNILALCPELLASGLDVSSSLTLVVSIAKPYPQALSTELNLLQVGSLLTLVPHCHLMAVLSIAKIGLGSEHFLNQYVVGTLVLPCLQVVSTPSPGVLGNEKKGVTVAAAQLMSQTEEMLELLKEQQKTMETIPEKTTDICTPLISAKAAALDVFSQLADTFVRRPEALEEWLENILSTLEKNSGHVPYHVTTLVAAILVLTEEHELLNTVLKILVTISKCDPTQGPSLLPLMMYRLNRETMPNTRLEILNTIPMLASHKVTVTPVLKTLQAFSGFEELRPFALRLICSLWHLDDRCFVHMQKMLLSPESSKSSAGHKVSEWLVAKSACIRDICRERPHQHGADMLSMLSAILNDCTAENEAVPSYLALQGLYALCEEEVVDVRTAWTVLALKLAKETRPQVIQGICELFSLVPGLHVETPEYEAFMAETVTTLWTHSRSDDRTVAQAAFKALAEYPQNCFILDHLPGEITRDVHEAAAKAAEEEDDGEELTAPPGFCFLRLMKSLSAEITPAYEEFLTSLISEEVTNLPRGIYHASLRKQGLPTNQNKALAEIPQFLQMQHEKIRHPGIQPSLAVGVLLSYNPPIELGRDGKPRKNNIISYGRTYHQMLYSLLHEVPVEPGDWHRSLVLAQAWTSFMDRCYQAYLESREAELELQMFQGQVSDPEEHELRTLTTWLWSRDKLTDLIKSASRGNPSVQGNCVCALVGLTIAVTKYANGLDEEHVTAGEKMTEHLSAPHWLNITVNTLLCIFNPDHVPAGRIFTMCQQRGAQDRTTATLLARGCACVAFSQLTPVLITTSSDIIPRVLAAMVAWLPGKPQTPPQPQLQFYVGLGLGVFLAALVEEHYSDAGSSCLKGCVTFMQAVKSLQDCCFSSSKHRLGSLLGFGLCLSSLSGDGKTDSRTLVSAVQEQLSVAMEMTDAADEHFEGLCMSIALCASAAYSYNILSTDVLSQITARLYRAHCDNTQSVGISLSVATLCYSVLQMGHPSVADIVTQMYNSWMSTLRLESSGDRDRLAALNGLLALSGSEKAVLKFPEDTGCTPPATAVNLSEVVKVATDLTATRGDLDLQTSSAWLLGLLHYSSSAAVESRSSVPSTYQYLPDTSLLRAGVDLLIQAGKQGSEAVTEQQVTTVLQCMVEGPSRPLPPLGWASLLSPLLRRNYGADVERLSVQLAVTQSVSAPSAALFMSSWLLPPLFDTLQEPTQLLVYESLPILIKSVPVPKLQDFLDGGFSQAVQGKMEFKKTPASKEKGSGGQESMDVVALQGLAAALRVHDPPQLVTLVLYQTLEKVYVSIPATGNYRVYQALCECLAEVPDEVVDKVVKVSSYASSEELLKDLYVRCYLVARGSQPLSWLNAIIEIFMYQEQDTSTMEAGFLLLLRCFHSCVQGKPEHSKCEAGHCQQWLLELMGHMKNLATGTVEIPDEISVIKVLEAAMFVFSTAVVAWSEMKANVILGLTPFSSHQSKVKPWIKSEILVTLMPSALESLVLVESWKQMTGKLIDWFIALHAAPSIQEMPKMKKLIKSCVYSLRHTIEFGKMAAWSAAYKMD